MLITVHEIAHQWWYGLVGSDQAVNPWLDEALATYSEYAFIEEQFPALKDWWWQFRVNSLSPQGFVDSTVYEFESRRAYINAVYLRGVRMLHELRDQLGTEGFYAWLRRYAEAGAGRIMTPEAFWSLLTPVQFELTSGVRERYLKQPQIVYINGVDSD
jgi:aminopeptidase N